MEIGAELNELHEHAEHAVHQPSLQPVSVSMAGLAVCVACVAVLSHRAHTEEIIDQARLSDGWAHYQSKSTRRQNAQLFADLIGTVAPRDLARANALQEQYRQEADRLDVDGKEIIAKNDELERDFAQEEQKASRFDLAEAVLEASIVITSVTLLTRRRGFFIAGIGCALIGVGFAASAFVLH